MDAMNESQLINVHVEDLHHPTFIIDKVSNTTSVQDSVYSSPQSFHPSLSSESMSDSCSGTWSSPAPSIAYSPSPVPAEYRHEGATWSQRTPSYGLQPFTALSQTQYQLEMSVGNFSSDIPCHPYFKTPYFVPAGDDCQTQGMDGIGEWADIDYSRASSEHLLESSPAPSTGTAPTIVAANNSPHLEHTQIKQGQTSEHTPACMVKAAKNKGSNKSSTAYPCPFLPYGCPATFSSKNEWKRHLNTQHLALSTYRCDLCPPKPQSRSSPSQQTNEFNRRDLFIQHLRRMHCVASPPAVSSSKVSSPDSAKLFNTPEALSEHASRCHIPPPSPPSSANCIFCCSSFSGRHAWDQRTEHISRHLDRLRRDGKQVPSADEWRRDVEVERWCLEKGILVLHAGRDGRGRVRVKGGRAKV